ncbi:sister chromatid cohesion 1 protein 1 isoform X2 [Ricinus communis]|uniref:sister chromatid cohesion 1 protein 1 isoform X2 n=1 Tax=Ricinus communis TaxID=3988 RepID=UPI00201AE560|nr:sister chromatid cohesion 1 protein 1 isoform X2 [Ricinus communis]
MFYSHQLLARKAPLGQIWMAATMHAKINRRKLDKLNIIKIWLRLTLSKSFPFLNSVSNLCRLTSFFVYSEEILNPSVPMALRLSGILMGGVVIVYERKVKLLYDDVTRLLVEVNEAWKVNSAPPDPTVLPKGKSQAKKEAVTLPENQDTDAGEIEQSVNFSNANAAMEFQRTAYFAMRLDDVDEPFINNDSREEDVSQQLHQADPEHIRLFERFDLYQTHTEMYNRYERFDIEEEETQLNFTSGEHVEIPTSLIPSPPKQDEAPSADEIQDRQEQTSRAKECKVTKQRKGPTKKRIKRQATPAMDYEQTIIPGPTYQSWLQNASDIVSRRGRKRKARRDIMSKMKTANLMELPPLVLIDDLSANANGEIYYPAPLLELWMKSTQPPHDSPSARTSAPLPPEPSSSSPLERGDYQDPTGYPFEDFQSGIGSESLGAIEKQRKTIINEVMPMETLMNELRSKLVNNGSKTTEANLVTPGNSGDEVRSIPSSGSGHGMPSHQSEVHSARKRPYSGSRHSGSSLEPVEEENSWQFPDPNFKLARLSEKDLTPDQELLVETGPTQTQKPIINPPVDKMTDTIRMQMKTHFETPGAPAVESLNNLAAGMNRKGAAMLFYQTCVLASRDCLRVEQKVPYGEILISRGEKL